MSTRSVPLISFFHDAQTLSWNYPILMFSKVDTIIFSKEKQLTSHIFPGKLLSEGGRAILCHVLCLQQQFFPSVPRSCFCISGSPLALLSVELNPHERERITPKLRPCPPQDRKAEVEVILSWMASPPWTRNWKGTRNRNECLTSTCLLEHLVRNKLRRALCSSL